MTYPFYGVMLASFILLYYFTPSRTTSLFYVLFVAVAASFFVGFRGIDAGLDTISYGSAYLQLRTEYFDYLEIARTFVSNNITAAEPGFILYTYLIKSIGFGLDGYLTIIAFTGLVILFTGFKKLTSFWALSVVLYVVSISFVVLQANVIRQGIAVGLIILAIGYLLEEKKFKFLVIGASASLFHISAAPVMAILFFTLFLKKHWLYFLGAIVGVGGVMSGALVSFFGLFLSGVFLAKINTYFSVGFASILTFKLLSFFIFYGILMVLHSYIKEPETKQHIYKLGLVYICLFIPQLLFSGDYVASERFGLYRFALEPVILSLIPIVLKPNYLASVGVVLLAGLYGLIVYNLPTVQQILRVF